MKICIATPAPAHSQKGNRITADRWAGILRDLNHTVEVAQEYLGQPCDILVALHAFKSYPSMRRFRDQRPDAPLVLGLTGTDLYGDIHTRAEAAESLEMATRLVVLQPLGLEELPASARGKTRVIYQSVPTQLVKATPTEDTWDVCVLGHLRPVKDPFRTARAARLLPESSRIRVLQVGGALGEDMAEAARQEGAANPRYRWLGELPRVEALTVLASCRLLSLTSHLEGGANVLSEALTLGVPALSSRISGSIGLLGEDYPGYFPVGDTRALTELLLRAENDSAFLANVRDHCATRRSQFEPDRERASWRALLDELTPPPVHDGG